VTPNEGHVLEDAQAEGEECHQIQVDAEPIPDEVSATATSALVTKPDRKIRLS
jgi:hypothetical protein